ncbi:MAG TPA: hypothetical protein VIH99_13850 [Bdellovibrionota bacterium]|jgi:hypothetical protein
MPTKILVVESANFQLGANAGEHAERISIEDLPGRIEKHFEDPANKEKLFVLASSENRFKVVFADATAGPGSVSVAFCGNTQDAIRFLPSLAIFADDQRSLGLKNSLDEGATIYSEGFFNCKAVGTKLDPCHVFARARLSAASAASVWGCLQSLVFLGLQKLPEIGEKGTGEKVDVQIGADEKVVALTVRFDLPPEEFTEMRGSPMLALSRTSADVMESRYLMDSKKIEFNCLFYRTGGAQCPIEITSFHREAELESATFVKEYFFKSLSDLSSDVPEEKRVAKGGFKKKLSDTLFKTEPSAPATAEPSKVVVSGSASLKGGAEAVTVVKDDGSVKIKELEVRVKELEHNLKTKEEALSKATRELGDPSKRINAITNVKDSQNEGLKQNLKNIESELAASKGREKELMSMVDKAVQIKEDAAKKIRELETKLKTASGSGGSKVQMLERALDEQKRQNKELSNRVSELKTKLDAA